MRKKRLLLFDIDDTLVNTAGAGVESLKRTLHNRFGAKGLSFSITVSGIFLNLALSRTTIMTGTSSALSPENALKQDMVTISMRPISMSSAIPSTTSPAEKHLARAPLRLLLAVGRASDCKCALQIFCSTIWQTRTRSLRGWDGEYLDTR